LLQLRGYPGMDSRFPAKDASEFFDSDVNLSRILLHRRASLR
jgi:hypothetical protein